MSEDIKNTLQEIASFIKQKFGAEKVILFGSYAYGNPTQDSDIDLLVIMETREEFSKEATRIRIAIDEMLPDKPMDILVRTPDFITERINKNDFFIKEILTKGIHL